MIPVNNPKYVAAVEYLNKNKPQTYRDIIDYDAYYTHFTHLEPDEYYQLFIATLNHAGMSYETHIIRVCERIIKLMNEYKFPMTAEDIHRALVLEGTMTADEVGQIIRDNIWPLVKNSRHGMFAPLYEFDEEYFIDELKLAIESKEWTDVVNYVERKKRVEEVLDYVE